MLVKTDIDSLINESQSHLRAVQALKKKHATEIESSKAALEKEIQEKKDAIRKLKSAPIKPNDYSDISQKNLNTQVQYFETKKSDVKNLFLKFIEETL